MLRHGGRAVVLLRRLGGLGEGRSGVRTCGGPKARGDRFPRSLPCDAGGAQHGRCTRWVRVTSDAGQWRLQSAPCARMGITRRGRPIAGPPGHIRQDSVHKCQISHVSVPSLPSHDLPTAIPGPKVLGPIPLSLVPSRGHILAVWRRNWTFNTRIRTKSS